MEQQNRYTEQEQQNAEVNLQRHHHRHHSRTKKEKIFAWCKKNAFFLLTMLVMLAVTFVFVVVDFMKQKEYTEWAEGFNRQQINEQIENKTEKPVQVKPTEGVSFGLWQ